MVVWVVSSLVVWVVSSLVVWVVSSLVVWVVSSLVVSRLRLRFSRWRKDSEINGLKYCPIERYINEYVKILING